MSVARALIFLYVQPAARKDTGQFGWHMYHQCVVRAKHVCFSACAALQPFTLNHGECGCAIHLLCCSLLAGRRVHTRVPADHLPRSVMTRRSCRVGDDTCSPAPATSLAHCLPWPGRAKCNGGGLNQWHPFEQGEPSQRRGTMCKCFRSVFRLSPEGNTRLALPMPSAVTMLPYTPHATRCFTRARRSRAQRSGTRSWSA
jgi:hypothetical protein